MNKMYPQDDTEASLEGTAAHWVVEQVGSGYRPVVSTLTPNGQVVTQEMLDGADLFWEAVIQRRVLTVGPVEQGIETRVKMPRIHSFCWGTNDYWMFDSANMILDVVDYKFGHGFVDEFENEQVTLYVEGLCDMLAPKFNMGTVEFMHSLNQINITIVQPRCYYRPQPVRTWSTNAMGLKLTLDRLRDMAAKAFDQVPLAVPNSECKHCPGRHACPALQKQAYSDADLALRGLPVELAADDMSREVMMLKKALERLNARVEGLESVLLAKLQQGQRAPFHSIEHPHGRVRWKPSDAEVIALGKMFKVDLTKVDVVTPNQAIKLGLNKDLVAKFSEAQTGSAKLVPIDSSDARRVFGFKRQPE